MFGWNKKIKAGALQYVLVVSIIILIVLLSFILLLQLQQKVAIKNNLYKEAILNTTNGFNYISNIKLSDNSDTKLKFSNNPKEETSISKSVWGVFDLVKVNSKVNKEVFEKVGLVGNLISNKKAIYLTDNNTPLVVVGNTKITGTAYLPIRGIKRGNISGHSFYGNALVNGSTRISTSSLPINSRVKKLNSVQNTILGGNLKQIELKNGDNIVQSFTSETLIYKDYQRIKLQDISLKGNIVIQSLSKIVVTRETDLEDVILIAPEIEIESGVRASFQAFATKSIYINKNVNLAYPSYLVLPYKSSKIEDKHGVFVEEGTILKGGICFLHENSKERNLDPQIKIDTNAKIVGEVICQGNTELLGTVIGEVYTNNFITKQSGTRYVNHLYNGVINVRELPNEFVGVNGDSNIKGVSKWLY